MLQKEFGACIEYLLVSITDKLMSSRDKMKDVFVSAASPPEQSTAA